MKLIAIPFDRYNNIMQRLKGNTDSGLKETTESIVRLQEDQDLLQREINNDSTKEVVPKRRTIPKTAITLLPPPDKRNLIGNNEKVTQSKAIKIINPIKPKAIKKIKVKLAPKKATKKVVLKKGPKKKAVSKKKFVAVPPATVPLGQSTNGLPPFSFPLTRKLR